MVSRWPRKDRPRKDWPRKDWPRKDRPRKDRPRRRVRFVFKALAVVARTDGATRLAINEDNTFGQPRKDRKPMGKPIGAQVPSLGAAAFGRNQRLFLYVNPRRDSRSAIEEC